MKRLLTWVLTLMMIFTILPGVSLPASAESEQNEYEKMLESIKPENHYGLKDKADGGEILQAWNWSFKNITENLEEIAEQGFTAVLVSPPNEIKMATRGVKICEPEVDGVSPNGWWMFYEPAGFQINESQDNALGTKAEFVEMCEAAHRLSIKIMVDTVVGYMGTDDDYIGVYDNWSTDPMAHVNARAMEFEQGLLSAKVFHSPWVNMTYKENYWDGWSDYDIEEDLTQHAVDGKPDLATETQLVQDVICEYLAELVEAGADGFYFKEVRHIETAHDTYFSSDFWEDTLLKIREVYPDKENYAVGEILGKSGDGRPLSEYSSMMDLVYTSDYSGIKNMVELGGNSFYSLSEEALPLDKTVLTTEWDKSYIEGDTSPLTANQRNKIWALSASRKDATGIYFVRPTDTSVPNSESVKEICELYNLGDAHRTAWTNPEVKAVNQFANYFNGEEENTYVKNSVAVVERGNKGAVLVGLAGNVESISIGETTLANGKYKDAITGNEFTVENGTLSGEIGDSGMAALYYTEAPEPTTYPLWVGGEQFTEEKLILDGTTGTATYDLETNTLTLEGYTYEGEGYTWTDDYDSYAAAIYYEGADVLNLVLMGENSVTQTGNTSGHSYGVLANGSITVSGTGELTGTGGEAIGHSYGVYAVNNISVESGSLTGEGGTAGYNSYGVYAEGDITVSGTGELTGTGNNGYFSYGVYAGNNISVESGSLTGEGGTADAASYGVYSYNTITVSGTGELTGTGNNGYFSYGLSADGWYFITVFSGVTVAQGETGAFISAPTIDEDFTDAKVWYGDDETAANTAGAQNIDDLAEKYTEKYVRIAAEPAPEAFEILSGEASGNQWTAAVAVPTSGTYTVIFVDYGEYKTLNQKEAVTFTADKAGVYTVTTENGITLNAGDKIMVWSDNFLETMVPMCKPYILN